MTRKVALLAIDAGNRFLIEQWASEGRLPTLQGLLARGLKGRTMSLPGLFTGATWPSFQTGVNPARSGVYSWLQIVPGTYEQQRCLTGEHLKREPFWNHLGRAGQRVAVLDMPLSGVSAGLNGVQLVEWGAHDAQYGFRTWPPQLAREVEARFGRHPMPDTCNADRDTAGYVELRDRLVRGIRSKAQVTRHFLRKGDWRFFAQAFSESHCVGHQAWHVHDPAHPRHDPEQAREVGDPMLDVYRAIDAAIGQALQCIDDDTIVVVLASHGMGYKYGPQFLLDRMLLGLGVAAPAPTAPPPAPRPRRRDLLDPLLTWGWQHTPRRLQAMLNPVRTPLRNWMLPDRPAAAPLVDPAASLCFRVENNHAHAGIRVNLVGREPQGRVAPGAEYDAFCEQLARDLGDIVDLDTGTHVVSRVLRTDELYRGEHRDVLPDLLVEWSDYAPISRIRLGSPRLQEIGGEYRFCRSGDHFPGGMFVAAGPGIAPGTLEHTVSIMDFAPTFCRMLGVDLPDVDGAPIEALVALARDQRRVNPS
jgi:predicted AlkP superfamily phosphohydrolase/phosphomutase